MKSACAIAFAAVLAGCATAPRAPAMREVMFVSADVADVRAKPGRHIGRYVQDPDQETQVLRGETVIVKARERGWARVECVRQPEFSHNGKWEGYPGWIELSALTSDASVERKVVPSTGTESSLRREVLDQARRHLGTPYLWGGRSLHGTGPANAVTGVDCSGLVNWSFLQIGRIVPRDAHEQYLRATPIEPGELREGDLIFLARPARPDRIVHVAFYSGAGRIIEAPQSGEAVREITFEERFGTRLNTLKSGESVGDRVIYFGTLFNQR